MACWNIDLFSSDSEVRLLTWLSEDVWVGHRDSGCEVAPSVLSFKLPRYKLRLLGLKYNQQLKLFWEKNQTNLQQQKLRPHLEYCSSSNALSEVQQSVSVQTTWGVHLTNQCWGILQCDNSTKCHFHLFSLFLILILSFMPDLIFAVVIWLQMLHVESIVGRTYSAEVESMTDLEAETFITPQIRDNRLVNGCK